MTGSVIHSQSAVMVPAVYSAGQPASLPVAIDYPVALALRQMSMVHDELPKYLLAPEVSALAPLRPGSASQDVAGHSVEHRRAY
ncbi:putative resolvase [Escherichia coli]|nr:putative resolvase [Escherichia coli]